MGTPAFPSTSSVWRHKTWPGCGESPQELDEGPGATLVQCFTRLLVLFQLLGPRAQEAQCQMVLRPPPTSALMRKTDKLGTKPVVRTSSPTRPHQWGSVSLERYEAPFRLKKICFYSVAMSSCVSRCGERMDDPDDLVLRCLNLSPAD